MIAMSADLMFSAGIKATSSGVQFFRERSYEQTLPRFTPHC